MNRRLFRLGMMGGKKAAPVVPWYDVIAGKSPIAVYDAVAANTEALSRVNLINPGTLDLTAPIAAPYWDKTGWDIFTTGNYYDTGIVPSGPNMTWVIITNVLISGGNLFGVTETSPSTVTLFPYTDLNKQGWQYGSSFRYPVYASSNILDVSVWILTGGKFFINGTQVDAAAFANLANTRTALLGVMHKADGSVQGYAGGKILGMAVGTSALTDAEVGILNASTVSRFSKPGCPKVSALGDSITNRTSVNTWCKPFSANWIRRPNVINHGVAGATVVGATNIMANQVAATVADPAEEIILIMLGTNDVDDANVQTVYSAQLAQLITYHPTAHIYGLGILPRTGGYRDVNNPRIQAACEANSVTYVNTNGWIVPDTDTDGVHPNAAGAIKIANQIINLLETDLY